ncbi:MAG: class I SAM-dependent methyltransferase [Actinobacteria bacterium]|nr:class I SAM-dependent methyltransferase [Actinomycetota bacterium]
MTTEKYGPKAERWSRDAYADAATYFGRRGGLILSLGPSLQPGDALVDLACGDGALADYLPGIRYTGVDTSPEMVEVGRKRGRNMALGDLNDYEPPEPVAATTCFRAIYYAGDRAAFFRRVAGYTERKFVFDLNPRQYRLTDVRADLRDAGFDELALQPFFSPQHHSLPRPVLSALRALEQTGPIARAMLALRFSYLCAAFRGGKKM